MIRDFSEKCLYNEKYLPLLKNKKRYVLLMGGAGSGKSRFQAQKEIIKTYEPGNRLIGVRKIKDTVKDSIYQELINVIEYWGIGFDFEINKSPLLIKNKLTGSDILFRGLDDPEKIKSISKPTRIWIEEATELNKVDFDQLDLRLRGSWELQITMSFNPISDQHWLITDFWNKGSDKNTELLHSTYLDNRFVGKEEYEKVMERLKTQDERLYNVYALGIPGKAVEGLIFDYNIINGLPEEAKLKGYGLDFGYNDPNALIGIYERNGKIILDEVLYKSFLTNQDLINFIKKENIQDNIIADNARPEAIEEISRAGIVIFPATKGKDSIKNGIQLMKQYEILITDRSFNLKKEFDNYVWAKDKNGRATEKPVDYLNHGIDASRYGIQEFFIKDSEIDILIG